MDIDDLIEDAIEAALNLADRPSPDNKANVTKARQALRAEFSRLQAQVERYEDALEELETWSKAYPLEIFPEPDLKKAHEILKANGMTLDAISASNMRHVINRVMEIVTRALDELKGKE